MRDMGFRELFELRSQLPEEMDERVHKAIEDALAEHNEATDALLNDPSLPYFEQAQRYEMRRRTMKSSVAKDTVGGKAIGWRARHCMSCGAPL